MPPLARRMTRSDGLKAKADAAAALLELEDEVAAPHSDACEGRQRRRRTTMDAFRNLLGG